MSESISDQILSSTQSLFHLLEETRRALAGQREFNVELVRHLSSVISAADPIIRRHRELRLEQPALAAPLDHYFRLAAELRSELDKAQIMLNARRDSLEAARAQLHAVGQFTTALSSTR